MRNLVRIKFGSHLYGTNTPASDTDIKEVFIPTDMDILLQRVKPVISTQRPKGEGEKNIATDVDVESFALHKFFSLLTEGQMVALDMLFAPPQNILGGSKKRWESVVYYGKKFAITRSSQAMIGYCRQQANKYGIKGSRLAMVRRLVGVIDSLLASLPGNTKLRDVWDAFTIMRGLEHFDISLIPHQTQAQAVPHLDCCNRKVPWFESLSTAKAVYGRVLAGYGDRATKAEDNDGIDWKALSHAVRVGRQAVELLTTQHITFPRPEAKHLLAIKLGELPYRVVAEEIEQLLEDVEAAAKVSSLPAEADKDMIDNFIATTYLSELRSTR